MAEQNTRPLAPGTIQADLDAFAALKDIPGYTPSNPDYTVANGTTLKNSMDAAQEQSAQDAAAAAASRDDEGVDRMGNHSLYILSFRHVRLDGGRVPSPSFDLGHERRKLILSPRGQHNPRTLCREGLGRCPSDPTACSGYQCNLIVH